MAKVFSTVIRSALALTATVLPASVVATPQQLAGAGAESPQLRAMTGSWDVRQRMWTGPDAKPTDLPPAVAVREMAAGGGFVTETMTLAGKGDAFTRTSHINYNAIDGVFEYSSVDSRAPQQMHYRSDVRAADYRGVFNFAGGTFVAGKWGDRENVTFAYRVEISDVVGDRQTLMLFLRPLASGTPREFKAFEYNYAHR